MTPASTPITVKNGASVPASSPSTASTRKNSAARDSFTGLIGFSVMFTSLPRGAHAMGFDASELRALGTEFGTVPKEVGQLAKIVVKKTAKDIEGTAKKLAPVDTGFHRDAIKTSDLRGVSQDSPAAEVRANANYARYLEFGTSRMAPRPSLGPAAEHHSPAFEAAMAEIAAKALGG